MNISIDTARRYLRIDQSLLIVECAEHPVHQEEVHNAYVEACSARDLAKIQLDETIAGASEELRNSKDDNGKPYTGERITYLIQADPSVISKKQILNQLTKTASLWQGMVSAMEARRRMLSELTSLILQGAPSSPPGGQAPYQIERRRIALAREARR